jgi:hypothetical protein
VLAKFAAGLWPQLRIMAEWRSKKANGDSKKRVIIMIYSLPKKNLVFRILALKEIMKNLISWFSLRNEDLYKAHQPKKLKWTVLVSDWADC